MSSVKKILLVCTGNSCRSVMAAGLLKRMLKNKGDYKIMGAGTAAVKGAQPTAEAIRVMSDENIDVSDYRSSPLSDEIINEADLILVMEKRHRENILSRVPEAAGKVYLLSEFGRVKQENRLVEPDIPDPIGKPIEFYRKVFGMLKEAVGRTAKKLTESN